MSIPTITDPKQIKFAIALERWLEENTRDLPTGDDDCPVCHEWAGEAYHLVACFAREGNPAASMNSGPWDAEDWMELRRCSECGAYFVAENANY